MTDLNALLKPEWSVQKDIAELWNKINLEEQASITVRLAVLFKNGLPFELKHDKIIYIHIFLALAQIDIIACQIPLKFQSKIASPEFEKRLRAQLLDEIFHVMLSIKIVYLLTNPYSSPPELNDSTNKFCEFIRKEDCPKVAIIFLNLITEAIAEELVKSFHCANLANEVFDLILEDERRHISDAELYFTLGLPDKEIMKQKLNDFEEHLFTSLIFQYNTGMALLRVLGFAEMQNLVSKIDQKYRNQLKKLNLVAGKKWTSFMLFFAKAQQGFQTEILVECPMSPLRQLSMTHWSKPNDPTMVGQFNLDISCLEFFEKKYPPMSLTTLLLQAVSLVLDEYPEYSLFLSDQKLFQRTQANTCLVVKLPGCGDHLGVISFQDCHKISVDELTLRIRQIVTMMIFCYKKREKIELQYPHLKAIQANLLAEMSNELFRPILPVVPGVSVSNIGHFGYSQSKSPLFANEAAKITVMTVQKTPVWCHRTKTFEPRDLLPVSVSTDHRIFGGNMPLPKLLDKAFQTVFIKMQDEQKAIDADFRLPKEPSIKSKLNNKLLMKKFDELLTDNLQLGYLMLICLQTMWPDNLALDKIFSSLNTETLRETLEL
ncbi:MAG: 2-oxo acid dehydrogenase subunit E2 [Tatlockia sp.]|nr:2-oxo acid dehydrogenase subunit E2 [Tatlockia sp.]